MSETSKYYKLAVDIISSTQDWRAICVSIAKSNPAVFVKAVNPANSLSAWKMDARRLYYVEGKKIEAIKYCRSATGLGLKEAKEAVEAL
jgi:ribosomal protein L7/L12